MVYFNSSDAFPVKKKYIIIDHEMSQCVLIVCLFPASSVILDFLGYVFGHIYNLAGCLTITALTVWC